MKKLFMVFLAVCLVVALGATSFAYVEGPANSAGHMTEGSQVVVNATGNYLFVNPYAAIKLGKVVPAILEGDGEHIVATGSVPFYLASNCNVKVHVTATDFKCQADTAAKHGGNHYRGEAGSYNIITPKLSANGTVYTDSLDITGLDQDEWTVDGKNVYFQFTAPVDQKNPWVLNNIDELHAGWYTGTITFLVTQEPEKAGAGLIGVTEPNNHHTPLSAGNVVPYAN